MLVARAPAALHVRCMFRFCSGYKTVLLRLPVAAVPELGGPGFGPFGQPVVARVRHVYGVPPPAPAPLPTVATRYGAPAAPPGHTAADTAAAVAAAVARTILEVRTARSSQSLEHREGRRAMRACLPEPSRAIAVPSYLVPQAHGFSRRFDVADRPAHVPTHTPALAVTGESCHGGVRAVQCDVCVQHGAVQVSRPGPVATSSAGLAF